MPDPLDDLDVLLAADAASEPWRADGDLVRRGTGVRVCEATPAAARLIAALRNAAPELLAVARAMDALCENSGGRFACDNADCSFCKAIDALDALRARLREGA